jgi:hypothetical protein
MTSLSDYGASAEAIGHKVSRAPREKVLRKALLLNRGKRTQIIIRNISLNGAMIEGAGLTATDIDTHMSIELSQGQVLSGQIRWIDKGKVGIEFTQGVDQTLIL